jgi:hypothetical protein
LLDGRYLLVAAETQHPQPPPPQPPPAAAQQQPSQQQQPEVQQQQQHQRATAATTPPSSDRTALTTFFLIDVARGAKVDERAFEDDHFVLPLNACASVQDDLITLLAVRRAASLCEPRAARNDFWAAAALPGSGGIRMCPACLCAVGGA